MEKDNIFYKRVYSIDYSSPLRIYEKTNDLYYIQPQKDSDYTNRVLCKEASHIDIKNTYTKDNYFIKFDIFKELFFKLPYLSDLIRVSLTFLNQNKNDNNSTFNKEFNNFKLRSDMKIIL